jgi:hypothetical protein
LSGFTTGTISSFTVSGNVTDKNLTLAQITYSVSGTVSKSDGGGASGASVQLRKDGSAVGSAVTANGSGEYAISGVRPGTYAIEGSLADYISGSTGSFTISNGNVTGKNLTLQKGAPAPITGKTLQAALDEIKGKAAQGEYVIELGQDESGLSPCDIADFSTPVTIIVNGNGKTIGWKAYNSASYGDITVESGVTLVLKNLTFQGNMTSSNTASLVYVKSGGKLILESGAALTGNQASNGGAVYIANGGTFEMKGGEITGNKSSGYGHGVYIAAGGSMTCKGGAIHTNTHKSYDTTNDVAVLASASGTGTLTVGGNPRIDKVWLYYNSTNVPAITVESGFSGSATIDLSATSFKDKQILKGGGVSSAYTNFSLGVSRSNLGSGSGTSLSSYSIDSSGYLK